MDNRTYNFQGSSNENIQLGDYNEINQNKFAQNGDIDRLFEELFKYISQNAETQDKQIAEKVKENVKKGKLETAKEFFGVLSQAVQVSSAGVALAKAFGWII